MFRLVAAVALLAAAGGCATEGAIEIACPNFNPTRLPRSPLERQIQQDADDPEDADDKDASADFMPLLAPPSAAGKTTASPDILLLSGGGQWGAFGAGFLAELEERGELPDFAIVTGVSTGGLQSMFVATGHLSELVAEYSPPPGVDIVDQHPQFMAAIKGSMAGLKPLRRKIEKALCANTSESGPRCLIDDLKDLHEKKVVLIAFVDAVSGDLYYVDAVALARNARDRETARRCLTGAALASAAMPVFFQQVRINGATYYDGGVRQSVFESRATALGQAILTKSYAAAKSARLKRGSGFPIYVIRNGPTTVKHAASKGSPDENADALTNALRAEAIAVNQLEIGSIAALRLEHAVTPIHLATADRWKKHGCVKPDGVMFDSAFMHCLVGLGRARAALPHNERWIALDPVTISKRKK